MAMGSGFSNVSVAFAAHLAAGDTTLGDGATGPMVCHTWQEFATAAGNEDRLLLFLLHVEQDQAARSANLTVRDPGTATRRTSTVWRLTYLVVPAAGDALRAQDLLQQAATHLHRSPIIKSANFSNQALAATPQVYSLEEMTALWAGMKQPLQPSLAYYVQVMLD